MDNQRVQRTMIPYNPITVKIVPLIIIIIINTKKRTVCIQKYSGYKGMVTQVKQMTNPTKCCASTFLSVLCESVDVEKQTFDIFTC